MFLKLLKSPLFNVPGDPGSWGCLLPQWVLSGKQPGRFPEVSQVLCHKVLWCRGSQGLLFSGSYIPPMKCSSKLPYVLTGILFPGLYVHTGLYSQGSVFSVGFKGSVILLTWDFFGKQPDISKCLTLCCSKSPVFHSECLWSVDPLPS